jgi:hypothetical protein
MPRKAAGALRFRPSRALALLLTLALVGCAAPAAHFETQLPAELDVGDVERIAVAEFDGLEKSGLMVTAKLTEGIVQNGHFRMFERSKLDEILAEREFSQSDHVNPETANELKLLGVDALIFGMVDVYSIDDQTGVSKFTTTVGTGEYETVQQNDGKGHTREVKKEITKTVVVDRPHVIREGTMGVTFRMANVNTGQIVAIKAETVQFHEKVWRDEKSKLTSRDQILESLAADVTQRFLRQIQPQTVVRAVRFEKNEFPQTEVGIKFAQNGLWGDAADTFRSVAMAAPAVASAHYNLGIAYDALGSYEDATSAIERAVRLDPKDKYIQALAAVRLSARNAALVEMQGAGY